MSGEVVEKPGPATELLAPLPVLRAMGLERALIEQGRPLRSSAEVAPAVGWFVVERRLPGSLIELLPALAPLRDEMIPLSHLQTRTRNILTERGWITWRSVEELSVEQILAIRNSGRKTAWDLVQNAVRAILDDVPQRVVGEAGTLFREVVEEGRRLGATNVGETSSVDDGQARVSAAMTWWNSSPAWRSRLL